MPNGQGQYPEQWEADVVLRDGGTAHIRPIRPEDAEALVAFHGRLSPQTIYLRFFTAHPTLSPSEVRFFTQVDYADRITLVAEVGEELLGVVLAVRVAAADYGLPAGTGAAEVAFVVRDDQQGRGIGSILLEHVAAAANERGITHFVAEVLAGNRQMITVFEEAGYEVRSGVEEGVVRLGFDLTPTETSRAVMQAREHRSEARSIERLLHPRSVAVIGASRDPAAIGHLLLRNVLDGGFTGDTYAVNPQATEIAGVRSYPSITDVPGPVDLALVAVPAAAVLAVVRECATKGVRGLLVIASGFAESGEDGRELQRQLVWTARGNGMRVIGPNALGVINTDPGVSLHATYLGVAQHRGRVGFFSQSAAIGGALLRAAQERGVGASTFVSAGNRADVSGNDLLQYWEDDGDTSVIAMYLESFGNPRKFARLAKRVSRTKPIVAVRSGRFAQLTPRGHALTTPTLPPHAVDALLAQAGVIQVDGPGELLDSVHALSRTPLPRGDRVAIVGNSDALGYVALDTALRYGLSPHDPIDLPDAIASQLRSRLRQLVAADDVDAVIVALLAPSTGSIDDHTKVVTEVAARSTKPVLASLLSRSRAESEDSGDGGVAWFAGPAQAVRALTSMVRYASWRAVDPGIEPLLADLQPAAARELLEQVLVSAPAGRELTAAEVAGLLDCYGIRVWPGRAVRSVEEAVFTAEEYGYPVALKSMDPSLRDRVDLGGVRLNIDDSGELAHVFTEMSQRLGRPSGPDLLLQPMAPRGVGTVVGAQEDPLFGAVVTFGLSGVASALLDDVGYRLAPLTDRDAGRLIRSVRAAPLLFGYLGTEAVDVAALEDLLVRVGRLADDLPEVAALTLEPVLVGSSGVTVLHASVRAEPPPYPADAGPRRMRIPT